METTNEDLLEEVKELRQEKRELEEENDDLKTAVKEIYEIVKYHI